MQKYFIVFRIIQIHKIIYTIIPRLNLPQRVGVAAAAAVDMVESFVSAPSFATVRLRRSIGRGQQRT